MLTGSCLCEGVRYEIDAKPLLMYHCHAYVAFKAPWVEIDDGLPQYPEART